MSNSDNGIKLAEKVHGAIYNLYGKKYAGLKHAIWEKGFKSSATQGENNYGLSPEMIQWLDLAMGAYWQNRNRSILKQIGQKPDDLLIEEFCASLNEMYGNESKLKNKLFENIFNHEDIPEKSKQWIKKHMKSLI